jgi:hypothetical protein
VSVLQQGTPRAVLDGLHCGRSLTLGALLLGERFAKWQNFFRGTLNCR